MAYGANIFGHFNDIAFAMPLDFESVYLPKIKEVNMLLKQATILKNKAPEERHTVSKDPLSNLINLIEKPFGTEQVLLTDCLLQDKHDGELLRITRDMNGFEGNLQLYPLIDALIDASENDAFCSSLVGMMRKYSVALGMLKVK